jgi:hypothetical protein
MSNCFTTNRTLWKCNLSSSIININVFVFFYFSIYLLKVAAEAKAKLFIATSCCVQAMNNIWYDKIYPIHATQRNQIAVIIGFFSLGLLAPFFVQYQKGAGVRFVCINKFHN